MKNLYWPGMQGAKNMLQKCETCRFFRPDGMTEYGYCEHIVKFPDSAFSVAYGSRRKMKQIDGIYCECYKPIEEANEPRQ